MASSSQASSALATDVRTLGRAYCAGVAWRIREAIPGDYRIEIDDDRERPGHVVALLVHAPGPAVVAKTSWPAGEAPDVDDLRRQLEGPAGGAVSATAPGVGRKAVTAGRRPRWRVAITGAGGYDHEDPATHHDPTLPLAPGASSCATCGEDHAAAKGVVNAAAE